MLSGDDIAAQIENVDIQFGKFDDAHRASSSSQPQQWRKKSIFFSLPYWRTNLLRHSLDVMHIEKNVCDNVLYTILNDPAKTKDHLQARRDLQSFGFREEAWPDENGKFLPGTFTLTRGDKANFLYTLKSIQVPDGHSSNIARCIDLNARKVSGLKSHDCHVLMQQFLPLALKGTLPTDVSVVLVEFCSFFRRICSKVLTLAELDDIQEKLVLTLCHLEMLFPPSFFTVMVHLTVHLVHETKLAGPVQYRWMYPMERFLGKMKSYVRNKTWPEGSIAEGYIADEVMYFMSRYFSDDDDIETHYNRLSRVDDRPDATGEMFLPKELSLPRIGRPVGAGNYVRLTPYDMVQAHRHVLNNCSEVDPYLQDFRRRLRRVMKIRSGQSSNELEKRVHREFSSWFRGQIAEHPTLQSWEMRCLAMGPLERARRFSAYNVNGFKFCTVSRDEGLLTQNSGVFGTFGTPSYASTSDQNMQVGAVAYYGKVVDIVELNYQGAFTVTLFKCLWANTTTSRGLQKDELGITSVNFSRHIHTGQSEDDEPFILATEAQQVYYVQNPKNPNWSMVVHLTPRDVYDMGDGDDIVTFDNVPLQPQNFEHFFPQDDENVPLVRPEDDNEDD